MLTITADSKCYGNTSQYVARITGRHPKFTFDREFTGRKERSTTRAYIDEPGLYECCDIDKKGRKDITFALVLTRTPDCPPLSPDADPELIRFWIGEAAAATIARRLDDGEDLATMVEITRNGDSYEYRIRAKGEAKRASAAATIDAAIEQCWAILQAFPEREARKVLSALKTRVAPPKPAASAPSPDAGADAAELYERGKALMETESTDSPAGES